MEGIVYKIDIDGEIYVGSTNDIKRREKEHNRRLKGNKCDNGLYRTARSKGVCRLTCITITSRTVSDVSELRCLEEFYRNELSATLNARKCHRSEEYMKEYNRKMDKIKYERHKDKIKAYKKKWYADNKKREQQKRKEHFKKNKDVLLAKINCPLCGRLTSKSHLKRHQKTAYCQRHRE